MDPTATLTNIRHLIEKIRLADSSKEYYHDTEDLIWEFSALDDWLTKGGFLPNQWNMELDQTFFNKDNTN